MTTFADLARSMRGFAALPGVAEAARQQALIDARAAHVVDKAGMPIADARHVAVFSLGTWAQRYPVQSYDLGEEAAVWLARWCLARNRMPSDDVLHEALAEWQARDLAAGLGLQKLSRQGPLEVADHRSALAKLAEISMPRVTVTPGTRAPNRHERRRAQARRGR